MSFYSNHRIVLSVNYTGLWIT